MFSGASGFVSYIQSIQCSRSALQDSHSRGTPSDFSCTVLGRQYQKIDFKIKKVDSFSSPLLSSPRVLHFSRRAPNNARQLFRANRLPECFVVDTSNGLCSPCHPGICSLRCTGIRFLAGCFCALQPARPHASGLRAVTEGLHIRSHECGCSGLQITSTNICITQVDGQLPKHEIKRLHHSLQFHPTRTTSALSPLCYLLTSLLQFCWPFSGTSLSISMVTLGTCL